MIVRNEKIGFVAWILVIIGAINYLLVGLSAVDLISAIFGMILGRIIYIIIGLAGCYLVYLKIDKKPIS